MSFLRENNENPISLLNKLRNSEDMADASHLCFSQAGVRAFDFLTENSLIISSSSAVAQNASSESSPQHLTSIV